VNSRQRRISDISAATQECQKHKGLGEPVISRRSFLSATVCVVAVAGAESLVLAQNPEREARPTASEGPPPCEGTCSVNPFILIARGPNDNGGRSTNPNDYSLGVQSPNVWFEDAKTGQVVSNIIPGQDYRIFARLSNLGSGPTFTLCVDFMVWTGIDSQHNKNLYTIVSTKQGLVLMQNDSVRISSELWSPTFGMGLKPGDAIVRAYDPWADHYSETGADLYVNRDRHLAHKSYT
jgi:hypothetical protein